MDLLSLALNILFLIGSAQVARTAYKRKLPNLYWLAANLATASLGSLITLVIPLMILSYLGLIVSSLCTVMFIQRTFYRDRKSPYLYMLTLIVLLGIVQIYSLYAPVPGITLTFLGYTLVWLWQAFLAYQAISRFGRPNFRLVEDWIKARYWLWFAYTFVMLILGVRMLVPLPGAPWETRVSPILVIFSGIIQYITWVMPEPIRQFLNRGYRPPAAEDPAVIMNMTEEELLQQIKPLLQQIKPLL